MNVLFLKNWVNPETGSTFKKGIIHKLRNVTAYELIEDGYCKELPGDLSWRELYQQGYANVSPEVEEVDVVEEEPQEKKGFFNI